MLNIGKKTKGKPGIEGEFKDYEFNSMYGEIKNAILAIAGSLDDNSDEQLKDILVNFRDGISSINNELSRINGAISALNNNNDSLSDLIDTNTNSINDLQNRVNVNSDDITTLTNNLDNLSGVTDTKFQHLNNELSSATNSVLGDGEYNVDNDDNLSRSFTSILQQIETITDNLSAIDNLNTEIDKIKDGRTAVAQANNADTLDEKQLETIEAEYIGYTDLRNQENVNWTNNLFKDQIVKKIYPSNIMGVATAEIANGDAVLINGDRYGVISGKPISDIFFIFEHDISYRTMRLGWTEADTRFSRFQHSSSGLKLYPNKVVVDPRNFTLYGEFMYNRVVFARQVLSDDGYVNADLITDDNVKGELVRIAGMLLKVERDAEGYITNLVAYGTGPWLGENASDATTSNVDTEFMTRNYNGDSVYSRITTLIESDEKILYIIPINNPTSADTHRRGIGFIILSGKRTDDDNIVLYYRLSYITTSYDDSDDSFNSSTNNVTTVSKTITSTNIGKTTTNKKPKIKEYISSKTDRIQSTPFSLITVFEIADTNIITEVGSTYIDEVEAYYGHAFIKTGYNPISGSESDYSMIDINSYDIYHVTDVDVIPKGKYGTSVDAIFSEEQYKKPSGGSYYSRYYGFGGVLFKFETYPYQRMVQLKEGGVDYDDINSVYNDYKTNGVLTPS